VVIASPGLRTHLPQSPGPRLFLALWGGLAVVDVARAGQAPPTLQAALLVGLAAACSLGQRVGTALAVAGIVWLVTVGFVVNTTGQLTVSGPADGLRLALLSLAALAASAVPR
jgi:hypothetical protein